MGQYALFYGALYKRGFSPIVEPAAYAEFHMFPLAYGHHDVLRKHSPRLLAFEGTKVDSDVVNGIFDRFMVKEYVKSVKGTTFPSYFETPVDQGQMDAYMKEFVSLRGGLFTGGIVCKEFVDLRRYGDATNEWRAFNLRGRLLNVCRNSNQPKATPTPPEELVDACADLGSPYYTVDFAELQDGRWVVVETGDGQVSGLAAAQDPVIYYQVFADALERGV
ncbi:MAG: ATP-grasp domain-containing protein [Coriobacteriales bacterium]|nr:ATP-grasp domain-containing protein [Coriobacteriales bacterium]